MRVFTQLGHSTKMEPREPERLLDEPKNARDYSLSAEALGKYNALKRLDKERYILLQSLGEYYTERAPKSRIGHRMKYEQQIAARAQHNGLCGKLKEASEMLDMAERIAAGTYIQDMIERENEKKYAASIPNGHYNSGIRRR